MKKFYLYFLATLLLTLCVSCSTSVLNFSSVSQKDLIGEWSSIGPMEYIFYEDGTGKVGASTVTRLYDMKWKLVDDSLFIKETREEGTFDGAFHIDSLKTEDMQDYRTDVLYLSYIGKKNIISPYSYKGYGYNFNDGPNESFLSDVANGFLSSENGYCWLLTKNGLFWQTTDDGIQWLASDEGQAFVNYMEATTIRQTQWTKEK